MREPDVRGMSVAQARHLEFGIIGLCITALFCIFQPFSQILFSLGCVGVVIGGLAFNLIPFCVAGKSYRQVAEAALIVFIVFFVVVMIAFASTWAYGLYLKSGQ